MEEKKSAQGQTLALSVSRFRLDFRSAQMAAFGGFMGSAWRGALGHALRKTVCVTGGSSCPDCLLYRSCVYPYVFETPPPAQSSQMRKYTVAPHPYALQLPFPGIEELRKAGDSVSVGLVLMGRAQQQLPYLLHSLQKAGVHGIGSRRVSLNLESVHQSASPTEGHWDQVYEPEGELQILDPVVPSVPPVPTKVTVELLTPFRTKVSGRLIKPEGFEFGAFFSPLMRRISMLQYFHGGNSVEADFRALTDAAKALPLADKKLQWRDWTRYSSKQKTTMQMGGVVGTFSIEGAAIEPFWPWLYLGQWVHNGKAATMGLGRYALHGEG